MLVLAKVLAVVTVVWFYLTAQERKQPGIKWAVIGLVGYVLSWFLIKYTLIPMFPRSATQSMMSGFLIMQIPALVGMFAAYIIRGILIKDAEQAAKNSATDLE